MHADEKPDGTMIASWASNWKPAEIRNSYPFYFGNFLNWFQKLLLLLLLFLLLRPNLHLFSFNLSCSLPATKSKSTSASQWNCTILRPDQRSKTIYQRIKKLISYATSLRFWEGEEKRGHWIFHAWTMTGATLNVILCFILDPPPNL